MADLASIQKTISDLHALAVTQYAAWQTTAMALEQANKDFVAAQADLYAQIAQAGSVTPEIAQALVTLAGPPAPAVDPVVPALVTPAAPEATA